MIRDRLPGLVLLLCIAVALAAPASQALIGWGLSAAEFSEQGDSTLRVAGYAFSIWGPIYSGMAIYALRRLIEGRTGLLHKAVDAPLGLAIIGCGVWIIAAGLNLLWGTVIVIVASLACALTGLERLRRLRPQLNLAERASQVWPLSLLAGWLTAASMVNLVTVMTAKGLIEPQASTMAALAGIAGAGCIALSVLWRMRLPSYCGPVAWGLIGAYVAERADKPTVAFAALGCAGLLVAAAALVAVGARKT